MGGPGSCRCHSSKEQHRWQPVNWHNMVPRSSKTSSAATAMAHKLEVLETVTFGAQCSCGTLGLLAQASVSLSHPPPGGARQLSLPQLKGAAQVAASQLAQHGAAQQQNKQCGNGYGT